MLKGLLRECGGAAWKDLTHLIRTVLEYCDGRTYKPDISERWIVLKRVDETFKGKNLHKDSSAIISPLYFIHAYMYTYSYLESTVSLI